MPCSAIICDWNGTIIRSRDEKPLLEAIAIDIFKDSIPFHPIKVARILRARRRLKALYTDKLQDEDFDYIVEMFKILNTKVIEGTPLAFIDESVERYANRPETLAQLDHRILKTVEEGHRASKTTGIFSAGYQDGIERILRAAGLYRCFDFCQGDLLESHEGKAVEFQLRFYKRKAEALAQLLSQKNLDPQDTAYIGDSDDDEGCFELVGYPVISFYASDDVKRKYLRNHKVFLPRDETGLRNYLL